MGPSAIGLIWACSVYEHDKYVTGTYAHVQEVINLWTSGGSSPGPGGMHPRWRPDSFFRQYMYINIITKPTAYNEPREY